MSLSDCEKCWDTPCTCGHGYRNWSPEKLREQIAMLERVLVEGQLVPVKDQLVVTAADYMASIPVAKLPCACGTGPNEPWHNPGCALYPEGGYPKDQPWRGPP